MNNEPVAWIAYDEFGDFMLEATPEGDYPWQPLYTHPHPDNLGFALSIIDQQKLEIESLKTKTLTDFEIMQISAGYPDRLYFARAILRKAQND